MSEIKLYGKYQLKKANAEEVDPDAKYFILRYDAKSKDLHARSTLMRYALMTNFKQLYDDVYSEDMEAFKLQGAK